jgi:NAD(P)-dependent dehydrogenase (short-subunit alcohol dehydrogenase family)
MASSALITTRFTASSTAEEVVDGLDLHGLRAVVTGASSGLGLETARVLALAGADVTLAVRNLEAGAIAADAIANGSAVGGPAAYGSAVGGPADGGPARSPGTIRPHVRPLDLADRHSVATFTRNWTGPLHLLINNAGLVTGGLERTPEGWELQFATNHLGHLALALGLHDALAAGAEQRGGARIVALSSTAHMRSPVRFEDLHFEHTAYDPQLAYAQSKSANSLFAVEATRRWAPDGIVANTVNPGGVVTGLQRNFTAQQRASLDAAAAAGVFAYKSIGQGAATTLVAATAAEFAHTGGHYLDDGREAYPVPNDAELAQHPHGVKEWALDPATAERLWAESAALLAR